MGRGAQAAADAPEAPRKILGGRAALRARSRRNDRGLDSIDGHSDGARPSARRHARLRAEMDGDDSDRLR